MKNIPKNTLLNVEGETIVNGVEQFFKTPKEICARLCSCKNNVCLARTETDSEESTNEKNSSVFKPQTK
jgi:hypothetical protein